jgi:hypothetical protein
MHNMIRAGAGGSNREIFIEQNGFSGEIAFAKMTNRYPHGQFEIRPRSIQDDDGDFDYYGVTVDVKTTEYPRGRCTLGKWKKQGRYEDKIQLLCLFTGDVREKSGKYVWRGAIESVRMISRDLRPLPGREEKQYVAEQDELIELEDVQTEKSNG